MSKRCRSGHFSALSDFPFLIRQAVKLGESWDPTRSMPCSRSVYIRLAGLRSNSSLSLRDQKRLPTLYPLQRLRRNIDKGLPCGSDAFIRKLEKAAKRMLRYRPQGRPKKQGEE